VSGTISRGLLFLLGGIGAALLLTAGFLLTTGLVARRRRKSFFEGLGGVVRIGTPCRVVSGRALLPGSVALTPAGLAWQAVPGESGSLTFEEILRLETDEKLASKRAFLRAKVLRVTAVRGDVREFVLSPGHAWEWRQALGEWTARQSRLRA
jgi:hypothetical protein